MDGWLLYVLLALITIVLLFLGYAIYCGLLHPINIQTIPSPHPSFQVAYKFATGSYKNCGNLFKEVCTLAPENKCFGIYYDDPDEVPPHKLRYAVGSILQEGDADVDLHTKQLFKKNSFKFMHLPKVKNIVTTRFPFKSYLSILIGVSRVWPKIGKYLEDKSLEAYPWMEIYGDDEVHYVGMLDHQTEFFVKEAGGVKVK